MGTIRENIENSLKQIVLSLEQRTNPKLLSAIEYSLFPGGKRIRPILCIEAFESVGGTGDKILPYACALELIHTSSLIRDDLPCMDNHSTRRGKPVCWKVFGEATAMMASDMLSAEAYRIFIQSEKPIILEALNAVISMINGQSLDIQGIRSSEVNRLKTANLFEACFVIGGVIGGGTDEQIASLRNQGWAYGMEFQLRDDIADKDGISGISERPQLAR